jgi:hypothetical protein
MMMKLQIQWKSRQGGKVENVPSRVGPGGTEAGFLWRVSREILGSCAVHTVEGGLIDKYHDAFQLADGSCNAHPTCNVKSCGKNL